MWDLVNFEEKYCKQYFAQKYFREKLLSWKNFEKNFGNFPENSWDFAKKSWNFQKFSWNFQKNHQKWGGGGHMAEIRKLPRVIFGNIFEKGGGWVKKVEK